MATKTVTKVEKRMSSVGRDILAGLEEYRASLVSKLGQVFGG